MSCLFTPRTDLSTIRVRPMIDRLLFPETFGDTLAHLWMNKVHRTQVLKERIFLAVRALDFLVCGAVREPVVLANGVIPNQCFLVRRRHELCEFLGNNFSHARAHEEIRALWLMNLGTELRFHSTARLVACK